jgi:SAM-dependent methyltransferase
MPGINSREYWDARFHSGDWERRAGRWQTERFAQFFLRHVALPAEPFSLLDFGCGLGDALAVLRAAAPHGRYAGCDISAAAVAKCRARYGEAATFFVGTAETLPEQWDVIYCSNVLEHLTDPIAVAGHLLAHCRTLHIMVPYQELYHGRPITPNEEIEHQYTFDEHAFDALRARGLAAAITTVIAPCPDAYVASPIHAFLRGVYYCLKGRSPREAFAFPPHLICTIQRA